MKVWCFFLDQSSSSSWDENLPPVTDILDKVADIYFSAFFDSTSMLKLFSQEPEEYLSTGLSAIEQYDRTIDIRFKFWKEMFQMRKEYISAKIKLIVQLLRRQLQDLSQIRGSEFSSLATKLAHMMLTTSFSLFHSASSWSYQYYLQRQINQIVSGTAPQTVDESFIDFKADLVVTLIESSSALVEPVLQMTNQSLKSNFMLSHFYLVFNFCTKVAENLASPDYATSLVDFMPKLPASFPQHHPTLLCSLVLSCLRLLPSLADLHQAVPAYLLSKTLMLVSKLKMHIPSEHFVALDLLVLAPQLLCAANFDRFGAEVQERVAELVAVCALGDGGVLGVKHMFDRLFAPNLRNIGLGQIIGALRASSKSDCSLLTIKVIYPPICNVLRDTSEQLLQDERNLPHLTEFYQLLVTFAHENGEGRHGGTVGLDVIHDTISIMTRISAKVNTILRPEAETENLDRITEIVRRSGDVPLNLLVAMESMLIKASREFVLIMHFNSDLIVQYLQQNFELIWYILPVIHVGCW